MKRLLAILALFITMATPAAVTYPVSAVDTLPQICNSISASDRPAVCKDNQAQSQENPIVGPSGVLTRAIRLFSIVLGIASVIVIILSGLRFVLANGDANSVKQARNTIIYAIVGLVIALTAQAIVSLVLTKL